MVRVQPGELERACTGTSERVKARADRQAPPAEERGAALGHPPVVGCIGAGHAAAVQRSSKTKRMGGDCVAESVGRGSSENNRRNWLAIECS